MRTPDFIERYRRDLDRYRATRIEFSDRTYQLCIVDNEEEQWPFIQFDDEGRIKDSFCSCDNGDEVCVHVAVAYQVLSCGGELLHKRFSKSLWNVLCQCCFERYDRAVLRVGEGYGRFDAFDGRFHIVAKTPAAEQRLHDILFQRNKETERNSLKFSNMSQRDMILWRQGRPTRVLRYELSPWSDIAKWFMVIQNGGAEPRVTFESDDLTGMITALVIDADILSMRVAVSVEELERIIPALTTAVTSIPVYEYGIAALEAISYDKVSNVLSIFIDKRQRAAYDLHRTEIEMLSSQKPFVIGAWEYVVGKGFFSRLCHPLLERDVIDKEDIDTILEHYGDLIREKIRGDVIHDERLSLSYDMFFDRRWNLHIDPYLFVPGDLQRKYSYAFGRWVYCEGMGFYRVSEGRFPSKNSIIFADDISGFVDSHRSWLNTQEGFYTHLSEVKDVLNYSVDAGGITFFTRIDGVCETGIKDFGRWVFIKGSGFYAKISFYVPSSIQPGRVICFDAVESFIEENYIECEGIDGFFAKESPFVALGLALSLDIDESIIITPEYALAEGYSGAELYHFGIYIYVEGCGFYKIPRHQRLPEAYRKRCIIDAERRDHFIFNELGSLLPYVTTIDDRIRQPHDLSVVINNAICDEEGMWNLSLSYRSEIGDVSFNELWSAMRAGHNTVFTSAGLVNVIERRYHWMRMLTESQVHDDVVKLSTMEMVKLYAFEGKSGNSLELLEHYDQSGEFNISGLASTLRSYQEDGVRWMWSLYSHGLSGLLCDDMGLGKTHQAMALMAAAKNASAGRTAFLIVCPMSVIYHWDDKIRQFLPEMKAHIYHGSERDVDRVFGEEYDIIITSYGMVRGDIEKLKTKRFDIALFDEIQVAKNHCSRIHQALQKIESSVKIGLTGTPVENNIREIKALMDLVLPGYMPGEKRFRELFIKPIEKYGDEESKKVLRRVVRPFILRRKKEDVLHDLPAKSEEIEHCILSDEQRQMYKEQLDSARDTLVRDLKDASKSIPYVHIFGLLSHLKQICNHPSSFLKDPLSYREHHSGKWDLFVEILKQARASNRKVVVFSHYLAMLDIIENYLRDNDIPYAAVRGSTRRRVEEIFRFQDDERCEVFVGSLQAVGVGVDLTAASVVIHYDRWWSAAKEDQATDRVHRIGQTRGVQVFKLITKDTFEERIHDLIAGKEKLMEAIVDAGDEGSLKRFSREELMELLQYV